jgi:hypothetical protein
MENWEPESEDSSTSTIGTYRPRCEASPIAAYPLEHEALTSGVAGRMPSSSDVSSFFSEILL